MLGTLGVAVAALMADQFLTSANAADESAAVEISDETAGEDETPVSAKANRATLSDRFDAFLSQADEERSLGEAFAPIAANEPKLATNDVDASSAEEVGLKLSTILRLGDQRIAVLNGRPLRAGQSIDGVRVVAIREREVDVETSVGPITLELDVPTLDSE